MSFENILMLQNRRIDEEDNVVGTQVKEVKKGVSFEGF